MHKGDALIPTARGEVYRFLALGFSDPDSAGVGQLRAQWPLAETSFVTLGLNGKASDCVARCGVVLGAITIDALRDAHFECFGHAISKDCPPYETEHGQAHIFQKTQTLADISGFYRAFGLELSPDFKDRPDHVAAELEFMEFLCVKEAHGLIEGHDENKITLCRQAQREFLEEHLGRWVFGFARRLREKFPGKPYGLLAELLGDFLTAELRSVGLKPDNELLPNERRDVAEGDSDCMGCPVSLGAWPAEGSSLP